ncbi:hypothetical protein BKA61DRAFT_734435 [Leptodontidium sp. MPI-SDFR-AT-0119]|nr:hypothetical protein BKA61DRAFT_734435 [Leptodontidium sp. MPI-SDFR-AT-0119]
MASATIKLGVIGYGNSAKHFHLPLIIAVPTLEVHAIVQRTPPKPDAKPGEHCTIDFPKAKHYDNVDSFFLDPEIDLVLVAVGGMHFEYAKMALLCGKHVVVEKPFVNSSQEADELVELGKRQNKLVTVYHNRRYDGDFLTVKSLIQGGVLGELIEFESHFDWDDPGWLATFEEKYVPGRGMLFGLGAHTADQVLHLFGRPDSVFAILRSHRVRGSAVDDWHTLILQYAGEQNGGVVVTLKSTQVSPMTKQLRFFIRGRKGTYVKHHHDIQEHQIFSGTTALNPKLGKEDPSRYGELTTTTMYDESFQREDRSGRQPRYVGNLPTIPGKWKGYYEDLAQALLNGSEFQVTAEGARDGIRLFELARESAETGRVVSWN